jgi:hypothetical protein
MEDLSLHILDIVENGTKAGATQVEILIREDTKQDRFEIEIRDNGSGMTPEILKQVRDPFYTTRTTRRVGLGISLLEQAANECDGEVTVESEPGSGTRITATFQSSHVDRKPLGDIAATMVTLIVGNPTVEFIYESTRDGEVTSLDTREIREELGDDVDLTDPGVLGLIRDLLTDE